MLRLKNLKPQTSNLKPLSPTYPHPLTHSGRFLTLAMQRMEKFIVSARKYRPQAFDTVVGQQHITTTLKNAIRTAHLAHAFLFCGPRGVGKTTCARILAKTINCERVSPEGEACNECHSCKSFNEGTSMNIHELDAASNNSVDDIRSLVEQVRFSPQAGKYKVYIIDEVHMLSQSAFNAFLKTLEEPPPYAIFILATTEKHKILPTILSRCQIFDFKRITLQDTVDHLQGIASKEGIKADEAALQLISQKSEGCMRDALSILDKIVSFTNGEVNYSNTIEHLNILDADYYFKLMDCMLAQDLAGAMLLYDDINKKGFEGDMVLNGFAEFLRNLLICKDERVIGILEVVESFKKRYSETAARVDAGYLVSALNLLNEAEINFKSARNKRLHVELALIKLCYLSQALRLTASGASLDKKKIADTARPVAFRTIQPIAVEGSQVPSPGAVSPKPQVSKPQAQPLPKVQEMEEDRYEMPVQEPQRRTEVLKPKQSEARLIIETAPEKMVAEKEMPVAVEEAPPAKGKLSLEAIRRKISQSNGNIVADKPLDEQTLKAAWLKVIVRLKEEKNPAWQSFELAELRITDVNSFEAVVTSNISQRFLEMERNKTCEFLQKELQNRVLKMTIVLVEGPKEEIQVDRPLNYREQYMRIVEQFPLIKELKDRLNLELDF
jgi:DNA polymerase-3 subunit gamma/tau